MIKLSDKQMDNVGGILMIIACLSALVLSNTMAWHHDLVFTPIKLSSAFFQIQQSL